MRGRWTLAAASVLAAAAGFGLYLHQNAREPVAAPAIELRDLEGRMRALSEWRGKLLLVNFWATWCGPCIREIPMLVEVQTEYASRGFQVIGPALDRPEPVRDWVTRLRINYPVLVGDTDVARAMDALGDEKQALPFSVLIDPQGRIVLRHYGEFTRSELIEVLERHLPTAQPGSAAKQR